MSTIKQILLIYDSYVCVSQFFSPLCCQFQMLKHVLLHVRAGTIAAQEVLTLAGGCSVPCWCIQA